jgi:hypothetical protein
MKRKGIKNRNRSWQQDLKNILGEPVTKDDLSFFNGIWSFVIDVTIAFLGNDIDNPKKNSDEEKRNLFKDALSGK